jgi:hypothetical protein
MSILLLNSPDHLAVTEDDKKFLKVVDQLHKRCYGKGFAFITERKLFRLLWTGPFNHRYMKSNRSRFYTKIMEKSPRPIYIVAVCKPVKKLPESLVEAMAYMPVFRDIVGFVVVNQQDGWLWAAYAQCRKLNLIGGAKHLQKRTNAARSLLVEDVQLEIAKLPHLLVEEV